MKPSGKSPLPKHKLSASALNTFLRSPKAFYWRYIARLEPLQQSVATFDHDRICGVVWAEAVDRFYKGVDEVTNTAKTMQDWLEQTSGWVPPKAQDKLTKALETWLGQYYQMFSPEDGCRDPKQSELFVENDRFLGYLDGFDPVNKIIHEVKSTSRSPQLSLQLWAVQNSIQVKLYSILTQAKGVCIEFAWKCSPNAIFRGPVLDISPEQLKCWEYELNSLADFIYSLGDDPCSYPCHPGQCCLITKGVSSACSYQALCDKIPGAEIAFKEKIRRK